MRVRLYEWRQSYPEHRSGWVCSGEFHLDEVAERLGEPMMSVAWDRDLPGLVPQPIIMADIALYAPVEKHPARFFNLLGPTSRDDVGLMYMGEEWSWRRNNLQTSPDFHEKVSIVGDTVSSLQQSDAVKDPVVEANSWIFEAQDLARRMDK